MIKRLLRKGFSDSKYRVHFKNFTLIAGLCAGILGSSIGYGQSMGNYAFEASSTGSLIDISSGATNLLTSSQTTTGASSVTAIGFDFYFMGVKYNNFSINTYGQLRLGTTQIGTTGITAYTASTPILAPIGGTNKISNGASYKIIGSTPGSRRLVIEWNQFQISNVSLSGAGNMQVWLDEGTGKITYIYGAIYNSSPNYQSRPIFLSAGNSANQSGYVAFDSSANTTYAFNATTTAPTNAGPFAPNTTTGTVLAANLGSSAVGSRVNFTFTSPIPAAPTALTGTATSITAITANWTDNSSNELGFNVEYSTDGVNWTSAGTTAANIQTLNITGLVPATNYFLRVTAFTEGGVSAPASGNASTNACTGGLFGLKTVGATGDYVTLTAAMTALNATTISAPVIFELQNNYAPASETYPIVLQNNICASSANSVTIRPASGISSAITLTAATASSQTISIDGGSYYVIDGRPGGAGTSQLTIDNNSTTGNSLRFINGANHNLINYCVITGVNTTASNGVVLFSTSASNVTGNSYNTISNCGLTKGTTVPTTLLYSSGTAANPNVYNTMLNNNFSNFMGTSAFGINTSTASNKWLIDGNSFYQTAATGASNVITSINIGAAGDSFTVRNNYI